MVGTATWYPRFVRLPLLGPVSQEYQFATRSRKYLDDYVTKWCVDLDIRKLVNEPASKVVTTVPPKGSVASGKVGAGLAQPLEQLI